MKAIHASVILAFLCVSSECTTKPPSPKTTVRNLNSNECPTKPPSPKTTVRNLKPKEQQQSLSKGMNCGSSVIAPNGARIVGGEEARPHSWPWQVLLECRYPKMFPTEKTPSNFCGGSIISDRWIITAAHCLYSRDSDILRDCQVSLGKHDLSANESTQVVARIVDYFIHTKYDHFIQDNVYDLALCKLDQRVQFTEAIKPVCLPFGLHELQVNKTCYATGWGRTDFRENAMAIRLRQLSMKVNDESYCGYSKDAFGRIICAGRWQGGEDVCRGDSGGPLVCQEENHRWYLRGVTSRAPMKCNSVATFIKVAAYEEWIKNITALKEADRKSTTVFQSGDRW